MRRYGFVCLTFPTPFEDPRGRRLSAGYSAAAPSNLWHVSKNPSVEDYLPLLRSQSNAAFEWVRDSGFDPAGFEVGAAEWGKIPCNRFAYSESAYFFDVSTARSSYSVRYSPGASELLTHQIGVATSFDQLEEPFKAWLSFLRRELVAPDLWALVRDPGAGFAGVGVATDNRPFTPPEVAQIVIAIDAARTYLSDGGVTGDALDQANAKLDYLVEAAKRSGRMDWFNIAFSVLFGIATQVLFDPDRARELIDLVLTAVHRLQLP